MPHTGWNDLRARPPRSATSAAGFYGQRAAACLRECFCGRSCPACSCAPRHKAGIRSEEHTSELQSLMRISYAVFCLKKKTAIEPQTKQWYPRYNHMTTTRDKISIE